MRVSFLLMSALKDSHLEQARTVIQRISQRSVALLKAREFSRLDVSHQEKVVHLVSSSLELSGRAESSGFVKERLDALKDVLSEKTHWALLKQIIQSFTRICWHLDRQPNSRPETLRSVLNSCSSELYTRLLQLLLPSKTKNFTGSVSHALALFWKYSPNAMIGKLERHVLKDSVSQLITLAQDVEQSRFTREHAIGAIGHIFGKLFRATYPASARFLPNCQALVVEELLPMSMVHVCTILLDVFEVEDMLGVQRRGTATLQSLVSSFSNARQATREVQ